MRAAFFISQEIASCEIKSLRQDAQLAEKKPARARNKSCAAKAVARGVCEAHFCFLSQEIASCERKSLRRDAQLAEKKPARARNKSCVSAE